MKSGRFVWRFIKCVYIKDFYSNKIFPRFSTQSRFLCYFTATMLPSDKFSLFKTHNSYRKTLQRTKSDNRLQNQVPHAFKHTKIAESGPVHYERLTTDLINFCTIYKLNLASRIYNENQF